MKVAFLNCTDELNPEAGSELTCVFLDKIPGTLEFCKKLKLKDPNLYFDAYVHNGQHGFTCHALVGGTVPMRIDTRYHALLALKRRTKQDISNEECMAELKSFFEKPVMTGVLERTPITHFAAIYDEESHLCYFTRINKKSIFVGTVLKKREDKILVHPDDERFIIRKNGSLAHVKSETNDWFISKTKWKKDCKAAHIKKFA